MSEAMLRKTPAFDAINIIVAVGIFVSPWVLGFAETYPANWNAWISAALIGGLASSALIAFAIWEEAVALLVGIWVLISPWALGFTANSRATLAHVVAGAIVALLAAARIWAANTTAEQTVR